MIRDHVRIVEIRGGNTYTYFVKDSLIQMFKSFTGLSYWKKIHCSTVVFRNGTKLKDLLQ